MLELAPLKPTTMDPKDRAQMLALVGRSAEFRPDFGAWLAQYWDVWIMFLREAESIWHAGRKHYSARTIWEVIRHQQATMFDADSGLKMNNNHAPDCARLYMLALSRTGFFELRGRVTQEA